MKDDLYFWKCTNKTLGGITPDGHVGLMPTPRRVSKAVHILHDPTGLSLYNATFDIDSFKLDVIGKHYAPGTRVRIDCNDENGLYQIGEDYKLYAAS